MIQQNGKKRIQFNTYILKICVIVIILSVRRAYQKATRENKGPIEEDISKKNNVNNNKFLCRWINTDICFTIWIMLLRFALSPNDNLLSLIRGRARKKLINEINEIDQLLRSNQIELVLFVNRSLRNFLRPQPAHKWVSFYQHQMVGLK